MRFVRPVVLLRVEACLVFIASIVLYRQMNGSWLTFALLFFLPDVSIPFYWVRRDLGCAFYNLAHTYSWPLALLLASLLGLTSLRTFAIIWIAHIAWDRQLGFGLKLADDFWDTHLGTIRSGRLLWQRVSATLRA